MFDVVCVIPARLKSTRLSRKALLDILGKPMVQRTFERAISVIAPEKVFIATDSEQIAERCASFTNNVVMTSMDCLTGTDRVAEFATKIESNAYINLQGDEPIMPLGNIAKIADLAKKFPDKIHNGYGLISDVREYESRTIPKVVISEFGQLLYMSRSPVPGTICNTFVSGLKQICVYSYSRSHLDFFSQFGRKSLNEKIEDIEILRFLDNHFEVEMHRLDTNTVAVDTPEDLNRVRKIIKSQGEDLDTYDIS